MLIRCCVDERLFLLKLDDSRPSARGGGRCVGGDARNASDDGREYAAIAYERRKGAWTERSDFM